MKRELKFEENKNMKQLPDVFKELQDIREMKIQSELNKQRLKTKRRKKSC